MIGERLRSGGQQAVTQAPAMTFDAKRPPRIGWLLNVEQVRRPIGPLLLAG
jgi:hypothetical protein